MAEQMFYLSCWPVQIVGTHHTASLYCLYYCCCMQCYVYLVAVKLSTCSAGRCPLFHDDQVRVRLQKYCVFVVQYVVPGIIHQPQSMRLLLLLLLSVFLVSRTTFPRTPSPPDILPALGFQHRRSGEKKVEQRSDPTGLPTFTFRAYCMVYDIHSRIVVCMKHPQHRDCSSRDKSTCCRRSILDRTALTGQDGTKAS